MLYLCLVGLGHGPRGECTCFVYGIFLEKRLNRHCKGTVFTLISAAALINFFRSSSATLIKHLDVAKKIFSFNLTNCFTETYRSVLIVTQFISSGTFELLHQWCIQ